MGAEEFFNGVHVLSESRGSLVICGQKIALQHVYSVPHRRSAKWQRDEIVSVYTMSAGSMGVKVGISADPEGRAKCLTEKWATPHKVIVTEEFQCRADAYEAEQWLHKSLAPFAIKNLQSPEYFDAPHDVVSFWCLAACSAMSADWYLWEDV